MSPQTQSSIVVNCARQHSNLLRVTVATDGLYLFFLSEPFPGGTPTLIGEGDFMSFNDYPEMRDIVRRAQFDEVWSADMLCAIATMHEDYSITLTGIAAVYNDDAWEPEREPDFINLPQQADVA